MESSDWAQQVLNLGKIYQNENGQWVLSKPVGTGTFAEGKPEGSFTVYKIEGHSIECPFEDMLQRDQWAFIQVFGNKVDDSGEVLSDNCLFNVSVDYVWDDVSIGTREVTKYRESPNTGREAENSYTNEEGAVLGRHFPLAR